MTSILSFGLLGAVLLMFLLFVVLVKMLKSRANEMLVQFYKQCDDVREQIHKAKSKAEASEIYRDLEYIEDTFVQELPVSVTQKEVNLLYRLLEKKHKKLS